MILTIYFDAEKSIYPYKHMDEQKRFNETFLPKKEDFYSNLYMKDIKVSDYNHAKRICKDFKTRNLGEYHEFYLVFKFK